MIWNTPGARPGQGTTKPPEGARSGAAGGGQLVFLPAFVPGPPLAPGREQPARGQTTSRAIFLRIVRVALKLAALAALAMLILSTLTCPLAAESTTVQERGVLNQSTTATLHADTPASRFSREEWGLAETEWQRYQTLLQGIRGSISPATLSPLEVLGIHARDDKERADYAQRWAKLMQEDAIRIFAFQKAFDEAYAALNPPALLSGANTGPARVQVGDRLLLFVRLDDCPRCAARLSEALALQRTANGALDIYVIGEATDDAIRTWAQSHRIDPAAVRDRRLTLNHDRGELVRLAGVAATVPALVRLRNGAAARLDTPSPS